jgi:hypothetical protein
MPARVALDHLPPSVSDLQSLADIHGLSLWQAELTLRAWGYRYRKGVWLDPRRCNVSRDGRAEYATRVQRWLDLLQVVDPHKRLCGHYRGVRQFAHDMWVDLPTSEEQYLQSAVKRYYGLMLYHPYNTARVYIYNARKMSVSEICDLIQAQAPWPLNRRNLENRIKWRKKLEPNCAS